MDSIPFLWNKDTGELTLDGVTLSVYPPPVPPVPTPPALILPVAFAAGTAGPTVDDPRTILDKAGEYTGLNFRNPLQVRADGVTLSNCKASAGLNVADGVSHTTLQDVEVDGAGGEVGLYALRADYTTLHRVHVHHAADRLRFGGKSFTAFDSLFDGGLRPVSGNHADAAQTYGGADKFLFDGCAFISYVADALGGDPLNSCIMLGGVPTAKDTATTGTIQRSYCDGGAVPINMRADLKSGGITVDTVVFGPHGRYMPIAVKTNGATYPITLRALMLASILGDATVDRK